MNKIIDKMAYKPPKDHKPSTFGMVMGAAYVANQANPMPLSSSTA
jgi:hypothetical protein